MLVSLFCISAAASQTADISWVNCLNQVRKAGKRRENWISRIISSPLLQILFGCVLRVGCYSLKNRFVWCISISPLNLTFLLGPLCLLRTRPCWLQPLLDPANEQGSTRLSTATLITPSICGNTVGSYRHRLSWYRSAFSWHNRCLSHYFWTPSRKVLLRACARIWFSWPRVVSRNELYHLWWLRISGFPLVRLEPFRWCQLLRWMLIS